MTLPTPTPMPAPTPMPMPMPMPWPHRLLLMGLLTLGLGLLVGTTGGNASAQARTPQDQSNVQAVLDGMRGAAPIPCAFALAVIEGNGRGDWPGSATSQDSTIDRLRQWLQHGLTDPAVVPSLRTAMAPGDACARQTAARLLGRTRHARAVEALTEALRDPDASTRELAAVGLALSGSPGAYAPLVAALRDVEPQVRSASATALGKLGDHRATTELVPLLQRDRNADVRRAAAIALGALD